MLSTSGIFQMTTATDFWRWLTLGLAGLTGMILKAHRELPRMDAEQLAKLDECIGLLTGMADEQRK